MGILREALKARSHAVGTWRTDWRTRLIRLPLETSFSAFSS
jgi:hypothetical protein